MRYTQAEAKQAYLSLKDNKRKTYEEEKHCTLIIEIMSDPNRGTISSFCTEALISDRTFYKWLNKYPVFFECYRFGAMLSLESWEKYGQLQQHEPDFNIEIWKTIGAARYGVGKTNRVRIHMDADSNPLDQYKQLVLQANNGDFSSGEFKQLMESVNIGLRAYEQFKLQEEVDELKANLKLMEHNANSKRTIATVKEAN